MNIHTFQVNDLGVNCYLLWDTASAEAALTDCGAQTQSEWERIRGFIEQKGLSLKYALLPHCHFDHIMGLPFIHSTYGLKPIFHRMDQPVYDAMPQMAARFGISMPLPLPQAEQYITEGDELTLGKHALKASASMPSPLTPFSAETPSFRAVLAEPTLAETWQWR